MNAQETRTPQGAPMPAVSVVVPCYNGGPFLDGLLATLAEQTFRDFEIVIVDDGSTDERTFKALAALDPAIVVIRQRNLGPAAARNTGIRAARAPLVLMLDCDDALTPDFLERTVPALRAAPAEIGYAFTDMRLSGLNDQTLRQHFNPFDQLFVNRIPCCLLLRRSAWEASGGYDEAMLEGFEDWEFTIALARAGYCGLKVTGPLFIYRVNDEGRMMSRSARLHGKLWGYIRNKHDALYRPPALLRLWRQSRALGGEVALSRAVVMLGMGTLLPTGWLDGAIYRIRLYRHRARIARRANSPVPGM
jgi:glycosyltransferase involved in cell wall biosynthesis